MTYQEQDFAGMLFAWPSVEGRIVHLYELDPTHVAAAAENKVIVTERKASAQSRSELPFCLRAEHAPTPVLLELDPTHM